MSFLEVTGLTKNFGGLAAVSNVSLSVEKGEIFGLIGPNGAGKTTLFNLLTGVYPASKGTILFNEQNIQSLKPFAVANLGISRTFQNIRLFSQQTVAQNIQMALQQDGGNFLEEIFRLPNYYQKKKEIAEKVEELLHYFSLEEIAEVKAGSLPYGQQRRLEIARAVAMQPKLLFLDEPAAGMNPNETKELKSFIRKLHDELDLTIILIEHDMPLVMDLCQRICVLEYGRVLQIGTPQEIKEKILKSLQHI